MTGTTDLTTILPADMAADICVFLDIDGTLLEFADRPDKVHVSDNLLRLIEGAEARLSGAMAMVTGRPVADVDRLFDPVRLPCAGLHGLEARPTVDSPVVREVVHGLDAAGDELRFQFASVDGVIVEDKGPCIAVHYRNAPESKARIETAVSGLVAQLGSDFTMLSGNMVFELKPAMANKGHAVERFMAVAPFADRRPVFIGDDVTDEDGFAAVNARDGISVIVGDRTPTMASARVADIAAVHAWLATFQTLAPTSDRRLPA